MKKLSLLLVLSTILTCLPCMGFAVDTATEAEVILKAGHPYGLSNGAKFQIDPENEQATPFYESDTMMVPLRFIAERLGHEVTYNGQTNSVEIMADPAVRLVIGEREITVNGVAQSLDQPAMERDGRTYVPLRAVSQSLGKTVVWFSNDVVAIGTGTEADLRALVDTDMDTTLIRLGAASASQGGAESDFQAIKNKLKETVYSTTADPSTFMDTWQPDGSFSDIDYSSDERSMWPASDHIDHCKVMALAAYSEGNPYYQNAELKEQLVKSLDFWVNGDITPSTNWWFAGIGNPTRIVDILLMEPEGVPDDIIQELNVQANAGSIFNEKQEWYSTERPVASTGGNLTDKLLITFKTAIAINDEALLYDIMGLLQNEMRVFPKKKFNDYYNDAEGIKPDGSFHQHGPSLQWGGYGEVFCDGVNQLLNYVMDTKYMVDDTALNEYANFILDGMQWGFRNAYKDFTVTGRGFSRPNASQGIQSTVKESVDLLLQFPQLDRYDELVTLQQNRLGETDTMTGNRYFWTSDYMAHKRPGFHIGIKTSSLRTKPSEVVNNENTLGYYMGDGVTNLMLDGSEYENIYPLWNWNRVPGTTTPQGALRNLNDVEDWFGEADAHWRGTTDFVGGVSDGVYGASTMDYNRDKLSLHKSWFLFDNEMVALGSTINSYSGMEIYTNVNQTLLRGDILVGKNGSVTKASAGNQTLTDVDYILHNRIGYYFPEKETVELDSGTREGLWETINTARVDQPEKQDVFELGISHGVDPRDGSYAYVAVMDTDEASMQQYAQNAPIEILRNDERAQAVYHKDLKMLQAIIYKKTTIETPDGLQLTTNKPCAIMVQELDGEFKVTVADPSQRPRDLWVYVNRELPTSDRVTYADGQSTLVFSLNDGAYAGSSTTYSSKTGFSAFLK